MPKKVSYCERLLNAKRSFDKRSFRWKLINKRTRILVGCPIGKWQPRKQHCKVGMKGYKLLKAVAPRTRCKPGDLRLQKFPGWIK